MPSFKHPLARLLAVVVSAQEQEGARAARLLHDEVGQILSAAGLQLDLLRMDVEENAPEVAGRIVETQKILEQAINQVRALSYDLNPAIVERAGLQAALNRLVARWREIGDVSVRLAYDSSIRLPGRVAVNFYKIAEAALDNAMKHSGANRIEVLVHPVPSGAALEVRDNGCGFDLNHVTEDPPGLGLLLMYCHSEDAGLQLEVRTAPQKGTIVKVRFSDKEESA